MATKQELEKARRRARVLCSDMFIYPDIQRKIEIGIKNDTLFEELEGLLNEARQDLRNHVGAALTEEENLLERAFVDEIFAKCGHIESSIW
jgi:hypothetical protein